MIDERDASILSIHAVAGDAVVRKRFLPVLPVFVGVGLWVLLLLIANKEVVLSEDDRLRLDLAWGAGLTTGQPHYATSGDYCFGKAHR